MAIRHALFLCSLGASLLLTCPDSRAASTAGDHPRWVTAWTTAEQLTEPGNMPPPPGLSGSTLRQDLLVTLAGDPIRLTFSNVFGHSPLVIDAACVAKAAKGDQIAAGTNHALTFSGRSGVTIEPGASMISDPVDFAVTAGELLAVSIHVVDAPKDVTGHPGSRTTSYLIHGDNVADAALAGASTAEHWYFLCAVDVLTSQNAGAIVVLGDSITDGRGSTTNENNRWPDDLARRLRANPATAHLAVLNAGIGGNRLLRDGLGPNALSRFDRDVLAPSGVRWLVVLEGINDLGTGLGARQHGWPYAKAADMIAAYEQFIVRAHAHHIRVAGATIMPFSGCFYFSDQGEADRQAVNHWIRTSGKFDAVIDFDAAMRDPKDPAKLNPSYDFGDHLHPSAAGHQAMADAVDVNIFSR